MSLNPLNELKRRLNDDQTPLAKRLCLAKNVIQSHHFPSASKERIVAEWLHFLKQRNLLCGNDLKNVVSWLNTTDELTNELKSKFIQIVAQYYRRNSIQNNDVHNIVAFLESNKLMTQFSIHIDDSLHITITVLQFLKNEEALLNLHLSEKVFSYIVKYYKESKKKLEFIIKFLDEDVLDTVFSYLDITRSTVINVCESILFPMNKKSVFASYLQTLVRKDNIDNLIAEKGVTIQSVLKIMDAFFKFSIRRKSAYEKFLCDFIDVFVSCYKGESQLIFAFYVMVTNSLNMDQSYLIPAMKMEPIIFNENAEKIKRNLFYNMLEILYRNEVDINVRLSDTLGVKISKVETKKTFISFLEAVMMSQLKMEGKPDKVTFKILNTALKLDPSLVEPKMKELLPNLMTSKKSSSSILCYTKMLNDLLETLFKLSRGTTFLDEILPSIKISLDTSNTEQENLRQKLKIATDNEQNYEKIKSKILTSDDIFPSESVELYGKLTAELMFRQNKDLILSLQRNFEQLTLQTFSEGEYSSSTIVLIEVMSAILSSFFRHCKMADHTVPSHIAEEFWASLQSFEKECLKKFGEILIKMNNDSQLLNIFLKLCLSFCHLKLLNIKYSNNKLLIPLTDISSEVFDLSVLLPCLTVEQWNDIVSKIVDDETKLILNEILTLKTIAIKALSNESNATNNEAAIQTKNYIIKQLNSIPQILDRNRYISNILLTDLEKRQVKEITKCLVKQCIAQSGTEILKNDYIVNNKPLLSALLLETIKNVLICFENTNVLAKSVIKSEFDFIAFAKENDMKEYFDQLTLIEDKSDMLSICIEILKELKIYYLKETYQLVAIFVLLTIKKNRQKKLRRKADYILQSIFELTPQTPDLYKIFPVSVIFNFKENTLIELLSLKIKTSNNLLLIKSLVESAVKRVKVEGDIVKNIVDILLARHSKIKSTNMAFFSEPAFQISCIILPLIVKQKKAITLSVYRSILADLQEKLHKSLLQCFKNINYENNVLNGTVDEAVNVDESMVVSESTIATLNAISAYSLTLSKYCESNDAEDTKNLDYLWSGLEYFVQNAIRSLQNQESKYQHVESSLQLLNSVLRYIKKLESHQIFQTRDKLFLEIWNSVKARLSMVLDEDMNRKCMHNACLEDIGVTIRFLCEWVSVEGFNGQFVTDLGSLSSLEVPAKLLSNENQLKSYLTTHKVARFLWVQILKANIVGPKCVAISKLMYQNSRNLKSFIRQHYETEHTGVIIRSKKKKLTVEYQTEGSDEIEMKIVKMNDKVCEMLKINVDAVSEAVLAAKKINLDYKFLDSIFELQHSLHYILGRNSLHISCEVSWQSFFILFDGCVALLNSLLVSREELLEDRWPCYMQCYRALVSCLCNRSSTQTQLEKNVQEKLGELAHSIEKITQSVCKRKTQVSRIAAYTVGDICSSLEKSVPSRNVRQHLENTIALLIQASDTAHAMTFLRRALAGSAGQMTLTNMYSMYKRYHKYVGNA